MSNTSATGGYLSPAATPAPLADSALEDFLQAVVSGVTGLAANSVLPLWPDDVSTQPDDSTNWCALGVCAQALTANPTLEHTGTDDGLDQLQAHEELSLQTTFYGPQAQFYAGLLRDGMYLTQNGEGLRTQGMAFVSASSIRTVPQLVGQQWFRRYELFIQLRRQVLRTYPVLNILSATPTVTD